MNKYLKGSLSLVQAGTRFHLIDTAHDIHYDLYLKIKKGDSYDGELTAHFGLLHISPELFFDFAGTTIKEIVINGHKLATTDGYESLRELRSLKVPQDNLKVGANEIRILFSNSYANDGLGMHSFVDTDGKQYIYSQLEAYAANKVFPCFDQPDLKATLSLTMAVPKEWVAISNQPVCEEGTKKLDVKKHLTEEEEQTHKLTHFQKTLKLPTYLYAFIAGPYLEIKCNKLYNNITMSCYSRESLFPYLKEQAEEIFEITRECLIFFESFFNFPYPFAKYDSIFCPEYKFGAMENAGAVTFNDLYIWREKVTIDRNTVRAATITHEASHHWFGDLVTMKWWNDLWLNESFAVYISYFCLTKIEPHLKTTKFCDVWLRFFGRKCTGYNADEKSTTHAISGEVLNTEQAETIFDGITYSKGASALKQLVCLIGVENFSKAVSAYFKKFAWGNATIEDFTSCLQDYYTPSFPGCPQNLREWRSEWIEKAGLNQCVPLFNPNDTSATASLVIKQSAVLEAFPTLRHHKLKVAFFNESGEIYQTKEVMLTNTPQTTLTYDGSKHPKAVLLNYEDEAFIKVILDEHSLAFFKKKLGAVKDELTRGLIWRSIFDMVKDGKLSGYGFTEIAEEAIEHETSDSILESLYLFFSSYLFDLSPSILNDNFIKPRLFGKTLRRLINTEKDNANRIVLLRNNLIQLSSLGEQVSVDNVVKLLHWLEGTEEELKNVELTLANKWSIVRILHRYPRISDTTKVQIFNKVAELDKSDRRNLAEKYCQTMRSRAEDKKKLWTSFLDPNNKPSIQVFQQELNGYYNSISDKDEHAQQFFDNIQSVFQTLSGEFASNFYNYLFPEHERLDYYLERVNKLLHEVKEEGKLRKLLLNSLYDLQRKKKGYEASAPDVLRELFDINL